MHRLFSYRSVQSEKNGKIEILHWLCRTFVMVDDCYQSGPYLKAMWQNAIRRLPAKECVKRVLLLGLGAGSAINPIYSHFPTATITVIEWDPAMVEISQQLKLYNHNIHLEILVGDAVQVLTELNREFDVILIDLYKGSAPEPRLSSSEMIASIRGVTTTSGNIILNAFMNKELLGTFAQHLELVSSWRFRSNHLALFHIGQ